MSNFEWETEEEWDEGFATAGPRPTTSRAAVLRWIGIFLLVAALGSAVGGTLWWRVEQVDEQLTAEVISSYELVRDAIEAQDRELFLGLLSGRDDEWLLTQLSLYSDHGLIDRDMFGLAVEPNLFGGAEPVVELDPTLGSASVTFVQRYRTRDGRQIELELTEVYRRGETRWLYSPPIDEEFWYEWEAFSEPTGRIDAKFLGRDRVTVWPIAQHLDQKLDELCQLGDVTCPPGYRVEVIFHNDPFTMIQWRSIEHRLENEVAIAVPTPTLIGLPVDAAGEEELNRIYAEMVLTRVMVDLLDYDCCASQVILMQNFINRQLLAIGITPQLQSVPSTDLN